MQGNSVKARSIRGAMLTVASFGGANILRLASNLILTRLLLPDAFGLMALVQVFITGLNMFSDTGIRTAIIQNKRGDDPAFLNTAWTMQIGRGVLLWLLCCAIAGPAAFLYDEPLLAMILPFAGLNPLISGFMSTNVATANRHLYLGRLTAIELGTQAVGIAIMVALAFQLQSVWALVIGGILTTALRVGVQHLALPGIRNRFFWDRSSFDALFSYGKFIFLSTAVTFAISQGDKAILGAYVSLAELGIYNIGYFLGAVPLLLCGTLTNKVVFPLYRLKPITESQSNRKQIFRARRIVIGGALLACALLAATGIWLIDLMYTPTYALAGPVVVLLSFALVPQISQASYGGLLLAAGDSQNFFLLNLCTAVLQTGLLFAGVIWYGTFGVLLAPALANLMTYPLRASLAHRYGGWDGWGDLMLYGFGFLCTGAACWWHWAEIAKLITPNS